MNSTISNISFLNLSLTLIPVLVVIVIYIRWSMPYQNLIYALVRMLLQLLLIGFILISIFANRSPYLITAILSFMLTVAGWIAIRPVRKTNPGAFFQALISLTIGCVSTLLLVAFGVIQLSPWYEPRYLIPLAGMIFATAMNSVSLGAERFASETSQGRTFREARVSAYQTSLLPMTNSLFAVGLVSLPGMMTGQILAGISPLIAVRYQIMVMLMLLGASGISSAIYLSLQKKPA